MIRMLCRCDDDNFLEYYHGEVRVLTIMKNMRMMKIMVMKMKMKMKMKMTSIPEVDE